MSIQVRVNLSPRPYTVHVGAKVMEDLEVLGQYWPSKRAYILADRRLAGPRKKLLRTLRQAGWECTEIALTAGESLKDFHAIYPLYGKLIRAGADRDSVIFALGGGSIGDVAGFIASTYQRGIAWIGIPTTLLAQVDSSIGGKTAVNHERGKNLIGTFHQPSMVLCDVGTLKTLSRRELVSGLGEAIKYGLVYDEAFLWFLMTNWRKALAGNAAVLTEIVHRSVAFKAAVVEQDEFDVKGIREALNFGHTFGHALESATKFRTFQHGEAVLWGMRFALALSWVKGVLAENRYDEIDAFLRTIPLPPLPRMPAKKWMDQMRSDKKNKHGRIRFVLLEDIGQVASHEDIEAEDLTEAYAKMVEKSS